MRVETVNGRYLLCGGVIPQEDVKPEQVWAPADGSNMTVTVREVEEGFVSYDIHEGDKIRKMVKDNFAFQCRYCLVLDTPEVPDK